MCEGFSVFGFAERSLPITWLYKVLLRKESELVAVRTQRMVEMLEDALQNLSVNGDVETAKSALIVFAGNPNEITMDGMFSCIERIENLNDSIIVRYGDYPIPRSPYISVVLLLAGITRFKI
jgi:cell division GTPase FtsZ